MQCMLSQNANALYVLGADESDQSVSGVDRWTALAPPPRPISGTSGTPKICARTGLRTAGSTDCSMHGPWASLGGTRNRPAILSSYRRLLECS